MFTDLNSPTEKLEHPLLNQFWVKRDDQIDPYISGNKWRKLKYILADALESQKKHLVTFGGAYSNHLVATASAASRAGFKATGFVRGEPVNNEMLLLCRLFGMDLKFISREAYKNRRQLFDQYFSGDDQACFIDEGGAGKEAVKGCAELIGELPEDVDHIFCAAGTGTTAAGLLQGIQERNLNTIFHVVPVLKGDFISAEILKYVNFPDQLVMHEDYHFGGYAKTTPELLTFMKRFIATHGMLIDPVYTAKLFYAIDDLARKKVIAKESKIVAIHTGGLLGILGMKDKFYM